MAASMQRAGHRGLVMAEDACVVMESTSKVRASARL